MCLLIVGIRMPPHTHTHPHTHTPAHTHTHTPHTPTPLRHTPASPPHTHTPTPSLTQPHTNIIFGRRSHRAMPSPLQHAVRAHISFAKTAKRYLQRRSAGRHRHFQRIRKAQHQARLQEALQGRALSIPVPGNSSGACAGASPSQAPQPWPRQTANC